MATKTFNDLTPDQQRLAQDTNSMVTSLQRRARNLQEALDSFCAGWSTEAEMRRVLNNSYLAGS